VTTFVGGNVKSTTLLVGDKVTKGALLTLENTNFRYSKTIWVAEQIKYLKSEYERQKTYSMKNHISKLFKS
jgi:cobalt-zinc-cadmium efflux system membrane fusion protein